MKKRMKAWITSHSDTAKRQNEYFTSIGDFRTSMYWKGMWVAYQSILLELDKNNEGFKRWIPKR